MCASPRGSFHVLTPRGTSQRPRRALPVPAATVRYIIHPHDSWINRAFIMATDHVVLGTAAFGAIPVSNLREPLASLRETRAVIQEALDTQFGAY